MQEIVIVPVRCGSSVKDKNIREYKGTPLLELCISKLKEVYNEIIVLSDSEKYIKLAEKHGVKCFLDEKVDDLTDITTRLRKFNENVLKFNGRIAMFQCTSPNLTISDITKSKLKSKELFERDVLISAYKMQQKITSFFEQKDGKWVQLCDGYQYPSVPRQLLKPVYCYNGAITNFHSNQLKNNSIFENCNYHILEMDEKNSLDIDKDEDFLK